MSYCKQSLDFNLLKITVSLNCSISQTQQISPANYENLLSTIVVFHQFSPLFLTGNPSETKDISRARIPQIGVNEKLRVSRRLRASLARFDVFVYSRCPFEKLRSQPRFPSRGTNITKREASRPPRGGFRKIVVVQLGRKRQITSSNVTNRTSPSHSVGRVMLQGVATLAAEKIITSSGRSQPSRAWRASSEVEPRVKKYLYTALGMV